MTSSNFFSNNSQGFLHTDSTSYQLLDQILGMTRHYHHHHHHHHHHRVYHAQPLDLQLGLGLGMGPINLGHKRVSEIRSEPTLIAPNRLLVQTVVDLNDPVPQHQYPHPTNHFLFHHHPAASFVPIHKNEEHSIDVSPVRVVGCRPIILGLSSNKDDQNNVDDGRLHSLETGVRGLYECPMCRIEFYSRFSYAAHVKIHHYNETRKERRMRLHNKYMSKRARRRRSLLRTLTPPTTNVTSTSTSPSVSVKIENQTE